MTSSIFSFNFSQAHLNQTLSSQISKKISEILIKLNKNLSKLDSIDLECEQVLLFKSNLEEKLERLKQSQSIAKALDSIEDSSTQLPDISQKLALEFQKTQSKLTDSLSQVKKLKENKRLAREEFEKLSKIFQSLSFKDSELSSSIDQLRMQRLAFLKSQNLLFRSKTEEEVQDLESRFSLKPVKSHPVTIELDLNSSVSKKLLTTFIILLWLAVLIKFIKF